MRSLLKFLWYELVAVVGIIFFTLGYSLRMEGRRRLPRTGPVLLLANHQSFWDPWLIGAVIPRHLVFLARKTLFKHFLFASLIRSLNAVPVDQEGVGKEGMKSVLEQLRKGNAVVVFPEGTRTPDGSLQPLKPGVHLLIKRSQATIVPVGLAGAYDAWPVWKRYPSLAPLFGPSGKGTMALVVGEPIDASSMAELPREEILRLLTDAIACVHARAEMLRRKE